MLPWSHSASLLHRLHERHSMSPSDLPRRLIWVGHVSGTTARCLAWAHAVPAPVELPYCAIHVFRLDDVAPSEIAQPYSCLASPPSRRAGGAL
jgi:hypothetical protein